MFEQNPRITALAEGENGLFCLYWSHLMEADKYSVSQKIPSVSGIYELYYEDEEKKLNLLTVAPAWLGGLRSQLREDIESDDRKRASERTPSFRSGAGGGTRTLKSIKDTRSLV